jgi:hypothetical protein
MAALAPAAVLSAVLAAVPVLPARAGVEVAPHRAIYQMALVSARNGSSVTDVRGKMQFEWADACDGWTIEQRFQLRFQYAEGDQVDMNTNYVTWEAKDGHSYRFNVRKLVNGELDEEIRGDATTPRDGGQGVARYFKPDEQELKLPPGTIFPTAHTLTLIQRANAGEKVFARTVFDGSDKEGTTEINAVVGSRGGDTVSGPDLDAALLKGPSWPVHLAFFPINSNNAAPEYEMSLRLLENGVAEKMLIDYGDFAVQAVLQQLEALPAPHC